MHDELISSNGQLRF